VERVNKNHLVNNLVEAYLKSNPGKLFDKLTKLLYDILTFRVGYPAGDAGDTSPQYFGWGDVNGNIPPILLHTF